MISVIITTKNRINLLKNAIESALEQTYTNFELIIVDDNSIDETKKYCEELLSNDKRIRYISIPEIGSTGANHARNIGIKNSKGDYIAFLDDDDKWHPEKLEKVINKFYEDNEYGMVFSSTKKIASHKNNKVNIIKVEKPSKKDLENIKHNILMNNFIGGTSNPVIKKDVLINVGYFDEKLPDRQDYELWIRIAQSYKIGYIDEPLTNYYFEVNSRKQITSGIKSFVDSSEYLYMKHENLFNTLSKKEKKDRLYSDYWLICERALYTQYKSAYKKYMKKRILLKYKIKDIILYLMTFFKMKKILYIKYAVDIIKCKKISG